MLELVRLVRENMRLEIEQRRRLADEGDHAQAAELGKMANQTAFMVSRLVAAAATLAAAGRLHWGDASALLTLIERNFGGSRG
ncbi:MAG: hypothetical protein ACKO28_10460 [Cyanobium sp.]